MARLSTFLNSQTRSYDFISYNSVLENQNKWVPEYPMSQPDASMREIQISPLMPDVLGEYFVLKSLDYNDRFRYRNRGKVEQFIKLVESLNSYYYNIFTRRLLQDYPKHNIVINFLIGNRNSYVDNRGASGYMVVEAMKYLHFNNEEYLKVMLQYTKTLSETINTRANQKGFLDDPDRVYQEACNILVLKYSGNLKEQKKYYSLVKNNTDKYEMNPKIFIDSSPNPFEFFDIEQTRIDLENIDNKEYAETYLLKRTASDERIPHIEVLSINSILSTIKSTNSYELANYYIERLFSLCEKFSYPLIKVDSIIALISYGPHLILNFNDKVNELFEKILLTPNQFNVVNVEYHQYKFTEQLINYKISINDSYSALEYFKKFKLYLISLKPNPNIGNTIIQLAFTAESVAKQFYLSNILITGDLFYNEVLHIHSILPPHPSNPMYRVLSNLNKYRNGHFD